MGLAARNWRLPKKAFTGPKSIFLSSEYSNNTVLAYNLIEHNGSNHNNVGYGILLPNAPDTGSVILNNTLVANVSGQLHLKGTAMIVRNNLSSDTGYDVYSDGSYTATGDARFVNLNNHDFKLQASSPYISAGADLSDLRADVQAILNQDIIGAPIKGKRTVGAYQFNPNNG